MYQLKYQDLMIASIKQDVQKGFNGYQIHESSPQGTNYVYPVMPIICYTAIICLPFIFILKKIYDTHH